MGDPKGCMHHGRRWPSRRPADIRVGDWQEVYLYKNFEEAELKTQASRCMDCGIPFCNNGCPLGNLIPDWNDLVYNDKWEEAIDRLHATNNFPEFTGRLCPAPCESACVLGISDDAVTIKLIELTIVEHAWDNGWIVPIPPTHETGKKVAVVGSGPAGLAAAQQLRRAGHTVVCFERADRAGGLLRYGIPEFKMEKKYLDRRLAQMEAEATRFVTNAYVGGPADHADRASGPTAQGAPHKRQRQRHSGPRVGGRRGGADEPAHWTYKGGVGGESQEPAVGVWGPPTEPLLTRLRRSRTWTIRLWRRHQ